MKLISVIIPTYNRENYLLRAIESVMAQTYQNFDLWIIDDGSTDNTQALVSEYIEQNYLSGKVFYIGTKNRGVSAARNLGVKKSRGEWTAFLDSDDTWLPDKLSKQLEFISKHPDIRLVHGEEIWIRRGRRVNPKNKHQKFGGRIYQRCLPLCLISPSAVMIKRDLLEEVGGFDEGLPVCEDYDLWLKITSFCEVGFIADPIIMKYGGHQDQLSAKYFAMDYWRVKSMDRILKGDGNGNSLISSEDRNATRSEIIKKSKILLSGYQKHRNFSNYDEINNILASTTMNDCSSRDNYGRD